MGITHKVVIVALCISCCCPSAAYAGWAGEEAMAIIAALSPLLEKVVNGGKDIKNAMKFNEIISQYDDMKKIQTDSHKSLDALKSETASLNRETNYFLKEIDRFVASPDKAYRLVSDARYREKYLLSYLYTDENGRENDVVRNIIGKLYDGEDISLNDIDNLYSLISLSEEEQLIRRLQTQGVSDSCISRIIKRKRKLGSKRQKLKDLTVQHANLKQIIAELKTRKIYLLETLQKTTNEKQKSLIVADLDDVSLGLIKCESELATLSTTIENVTASIKNGQVDMFTAAYQSECEAYSRNNKIKIKNNHNNYHQANKGTAALKLRSFTSYVRSFF